MTGGGLLSGSHLVALVVRGLSAQGTQHLQVLFTEQAQDPMVLLAQAPVFPPLLAPGDLEEPGDVHHPSQLDVAPWVPVLAWVAAHGAREPVAQVGPGPLDAGTAEVVPAFDGDGVSQVVQADGTVDVRLESSQGCCNRHWALNGGRLR